MPEDMDESLLSAIERYKNGLETPHDRQIIGHALASNRIRITPTEDSKIIMQAGGANFGESNEIQVTGSVVGSQRVSGFTPEQVIELLRLYDSYKVSGNESADAVPEKTKRRRLRKLFIAIIGLGVLSVTFLAGLFWGDLMPLIEAQYPSLTTAFAFIPFTGSSPTPTAMPPTPTWTPSLIPSATQRAFLSDTGTPTAGFTSMHTYSPVPTNTLTPSPAPTDTPTSTPSPTFTSTPTPEVLFTDTFEDYEYSTGIGWILYTEEEGKLYWRRITRDEIDNKFEHHIDCLSLQCVGRNPIPPFAKFKNFTLSFDVEYLKIPPPDADLSMPFICVNFRQYDPRNFYSLCFRSDGRYRMVRYLDGELSILRSWERTLTLKRGVALNSISLTADGGNYVFAANGTKIAEFQDDHLLSAGGIELAIFSFQNIPEGYNEVELTLDNIKIINIP